MPQGGGESRAPRKRASRTASGARRTRAHAAAPREPITIADDAHVVLVGLPGSGKTTVGLALADVLDRLFLDFDHVIETREGATVANIFATHGEPRFRSMELELTREMVGGPGLVLAPGGGWAAIPGAVELLCPPGIMVYLKVRPETAIARLGRGKERGARPLLAGPDPLGTLRSLLAERELAYRRADLVVDAELVVDEVVTRIAGALAAPSLEG
ncbi:MAG TPA: shikimate kinase [Gemmatimonadaceae bacterium]|nr:shikimate kinase [Gemmatimonadaceae bacterium]